jgi:hypothetical protein
MHCDEATQDWAIIAAATQAYTVNSLVPFNTSTSFGTPVPVSPN